MTIGRLLIAVAITIPVCAPPAFAQAASPSFEVSSVKLNKSGSNAIGGNVGVPRSGRVAIRNITLRQLIAVAFSLDDHQVLQAPDWAGFERYDIEAVAPGPVAFSDGLVMLQNLIKDRFGLRSHKTRIKTQGYVLQLADKRVDLLESPRGSGSGFRIMKTNDMQGQGITMDMLARTLKFVVNAPVENGAGLEGKYDISIRWTPEDAIAAGEEGVSIFTALKEQLGLVLKPAKVEIEAMAIEQVNRRPSDN